ncbi:MAG: hypothetical protein WC975_15890, partial [Phycisphaerae bacterium]
NVNFATGYVGTGQNFGRYNVSPTSPTGDGVMQTGGLGYPGYHTYRLTRTTGTGTPGGSIVGYSLVKLYVDDNPVPLFTKNLAMTAKNSDNWFGFGNGDATGEYNVDYVRWTTAGAYAPVANLQNSANWERGFEFTTNPTSGWSVWNGNPAAVTTVSNGVLNFKPTSQWTLWNTNSGSNPLGTGDWSMEWRMAVVTHTGTGPLMYADTNSSKENLGFRTYNAGSGEISATYQVYPTYPTDAGLMNTGGIDGTAYHVYRLTRTTGTGVLGGSIVGYSLVKLYVDDNPVPIFTKNLAMTTKNSDNWFGFGNGEATGEYNVDYVRWTTAGAYPPVAVAMQDSVNWERGFEFTTDPTSGWSVWYGNPGAVTTVSNGVLNFKPTSQWTLWNTNSGSNPLGTGDWSMEWRMSVVTHTGSGILMYADTNSSRENVNFATGYVGTGQNFGRYNVSPTSPTGDGVMQTGGLDYPEYHVYRLTRTTGTGTPGGSVVGYSLVSMYVDDNPVPVFTKNLAMTAKNSDDWFGFGNGDATGEYNVDYVRWTKAGAYAPFLGRGHQTLLNFGLQIQTQTTPQLWTEDFDLALWGASNFTTVDFGSGPAYPADYMPSPPGLPWANITGTREYLDSSDEPYASMLVRLSIGDEQDITDQNILSSAAWTTANMHNNYPNVIMHTNQGAPFTMQEVRDYMETVQPDMLMFDEYPFGAVEYSGISPTAFYEYLERYRTLGLEGNDGTGTHPIPTGVFLRTFYTEDLLPDASIVSESEIRVQYFAAWAFGYKLVDDFIYEDKPSGSYVDSVMFSGTGIESPTTTFYQVAETNRQSLNLGSALVRLLSSDVRFIVGRHNGQYNTQPDGVPSWDSNADPYITDIAATNIGSKNNGQEGDVIVGYFKPLAAEFTNSGHADDLYFMIVNGLNDGTGVAYDCRQQIRLDFDFGSSGITKLLRLSRQTGAVEEVALISDGGSLYHLNLVLDGGTGDLFKFHNGGLFVGTTNLGQP